MKISVDRLFHSDVEAIDVDLPFRFAGELGKRYPAGVRVDARIRPISHGVFMQGSIDGAEAEICVRCLEPFTRETHVVVEETFSEDIHEDDLFADVAPLVDRSIDLSNLVEQLLEVDEPMAAVCKESCLGICPVCGVNRNTTKCTCETQVLDERLAGLARLRDELESKDPQR